MEITISGVGTSEGIRVFEEIKKILGDNKSASISKQEKEPGY